MILTYIPCSSMEEARQIATTLLNKHLIACANFIPIESMYWWNEKIEVASEVVLIGKTKETYYQKVVDEVEKIHSYDISCIIKTPISANDKYENWLTKNL